MSYNKNKVIVSVIYRSPSQTNDECGLFLSNLEKPFSDTSKLKPSLSAVKVKVPSVVLMTSTLQKEQIYFH